MHSTSSFAAILSAGLSIRASFASPMNSLEPFENLLHKRAGPIVKYQALGDSYSAGNQAGDPVNSGGGGDNCMRTDGSYAYQLMNDPDVVNKDGSGYRTCIPELSLFHTQRLGLKICPRELSFNLRTLAKKKG